MPVLRHLFGEKLGWREEIVKAPRDMKPLRNLFRKKCIMYPSKEEKKRSSKNIKDRRRFELCVLEDFVVV